MRRWPDLSRGTRRCDGCENNGLSFPSYFAVRVYTSCPPLEFPIQGFVCCVYGYFPSDNVGEPFLFASLLTGLAEMAQSWASGVGSETIPGYRLTTPVRGRSPRRRRSRPPSSLDQIQSNRNTNYENVFASTSVGVTEIAGDSRWRQRNAQQSAGIRP